MARELMICSELGHIYIVGDRKFLTKAEAERYLKRVENRRNKDANSMRCKGEGKRITTKVSPINSNESTILGVEGLRLNGTDRSRGNSRRIYKSNSTSM